MADYTNIRPSPWCYEARDHTSSILHPDTETKPENSESWSEGWSEGWPKSWPESPEFVDMRFTAPDAEEAQHQQPQDIMSQHNNGRTFNSAFDLPEPSSDDLNDFLSPMQDIGPDDPFGEKDADGWEMLTFDRCAHGRFGLAPPSLFGQESQGGQMAQGPMRSENAFPSPFRVTRSKCAPKKDGTGPRCTSRRVSSNIGRSAGPGINTRTIPHHNNNNNDTGGQFTTQSSALNPGNMFGVTDSQLTRLCKLEAKQAEILSRLDEIEPILERLVESEKRLQTQATELKRAVASVQKRAAKQRVEEAKRRQDWYDHLEERLDMLNDDFDDFWDDIGETVNRLKRDLGLCGEEDGDETW